MGPGVWGGGSGAGGGRPPAAAETVPYNSDATVPGDRQVFALVDATGGPVTITLGTPPAGATLTQRVKKFPASTNVVTVRPAPPATVEGRAAVALAGPASAVTLLWSGSEWFVV